MMSLLTRLELCLAPEADMERFTVQAGCRTVRPGFKARSPRRSPRQETFYESSVHGGVMIAEATLELTGFSPPEP